MSLTITQLGKYEIRRELGKGAMGVVYEGFDPVLLRRVAIKTILPAQLVKGEAADIMARFRREAQAAGRLNHPGVVAVYDYGEAIASDDRTRIIQPGSEGLAGQRVAFIAMEFVEGQELKDHFEANECFTVTESARIMGEILDALAHSHGQGVIHRDIKPANLIMLADGRVKIADFGIARTETSELTLAGTVLGTPAYMSPEQFLGQRVDARSDLFACGIILYQFLTGEKPFTGNPTTIMYKVLREEAVPPCNLNLMLPEVWNVVLKTAMAKHPDDRYQTASDFATAIRYALAQHGPGPLVADSQFGSQLGLYPSQTAALTAAANAAANGPASPPSGATARAPQKPIAAPTGIRSHRALRLGAAAIALLIVLGTVLYVAIGNRQTAPSATLAVPPANPASTEAVAPAPAPTPVPTPALEAVITLPQPAPVTPQAPEPVAVEPVAPVIPAAVNLPKPAKAQAPNPKISPPGPDARSPRCTLILQRAMLDEPLSPEERKFLNQSCK
jgi:eukaryotic-like serine/threonine-protein kinase